MGERIEQTKEKEVDRSGKSNQTKARCKVLGREENKTKEEPSTEKEGGPGQENHLKRQLQG